MLVLVLPMMLALAAGIYTWVRCGKLEYYRERGTALFILATGTLLSAAMLLGMKVPSPVDMIAMIFSPLYKPVLAWIVKG